MAGEDLFEKVPFGLTLNDQGADLGRQKVTMLPSDGTTSGAIEMGTSLMLMNREKVSVEWNKMKGTGGGCDMMVETRSGQIMQGWWKAGFYSQ